MTLCLNMIVKNESHIIIDTLKKLINKISFDYYVICDTGSTDNTSELITNFFKKEKIDGELFSHEWKDFGYNRSLALQCAYGKSDYVFIFDADDEIIGNINLSNLTLDSYMLKFGNPGSAYERMCLVRNDNTWYYRGVLHEYICSKKQNPTKGSIQGDYFIVSGRTSSRNADPQKYLNDAKILEKGYHTSIETGDDIHHRYAYYCANSYMDSGNREKAKEWYLTTLKCQGWYDERYNACLQLFEIIQDQSRYYYLVESFYHNPRRVEGIYLLIQHYTCEGKYELAWKYYQWIQNYYENEIDDLSTKLFARVMDYTFYLAYYMIIVCEKTKNFSTGIKMFEIIFDNKHRGPVPGQWWVDNLLFNFEFFKNKILIEKMEKYLDFLKSNGLTVKNEEQLNSILFYTGFAKEPWNLTYSENHALGGSERAVINLAKELSKWFPIVITGDVLNETCEIGKGITFINRYNLKNVNYRIIIISRYVSFFTIFPNYKCEKLILMAHDTHFLNNISGCNKTPEQLVNENKIDLCVCLTNWHKGMYTKIYPNLKYHIINNGININFKSTSNKIPNSFIYTSGSIRGLERLLELWPEIVQHLPDSKLFISSYEDFPKDSFDESLNKTINKYDNITHLGKLNQSELYKLMESSEYWMYPCCFDETSCITAMEMMAHGIVCLYYPRAGLTDTMNGNGIQISYGNEIETLLNLSFLQKKEIILKSISYVQTCTWENRAKEWKTLLLEHFHFDFNVTQISEKDLDYLQDKRLVFYAKGHFATELLKEYIESLNTKINVSYTNSFDFIKNGNFDEVIFVHEVFDERIFKLNCIVSYLNTEPLNLWPRLSYVIYDVYHTHPIKHFYDYSLSNIKIMNCHKINNTVHLPFLYNDTEVNFLKEIKAQTVELYDFGIISSSSVWTNKVELLEPPRRKELVSYLLSRGFTVNIISGFDEMRDREIAKCKQLLNIHGQFLNEPSKIFEHIRCNRLLYAGYNILSETSEHLPPEFNFKNLEFKDYHDFFKMRKYKIIDCFTFYNELDLLRYRLETLCETVDYFILVEATLTHVGKPKKLYFEENKHFFEKYNIIHVIVDDFPFKFPDIDISKDEQWINEKFQRKCITRGLEQLTLDDKDLIIISDLDEIPDPKTIKSINVNSFEVGKLEQDFYYYNLNSKMDHKWYHSKVITYKKYKSLGWDFDGIRLCMTLFETIPNGGWHLSYFGDSDFISNKIKNFGHQEYNSEEFTNVESITEKVKRGVDIYNRPIDIQFIPIEFNNYLPPNYPVSPEINMDNFIHVCGKEFMGIGNLLFQIAEAIYYCKKYNYKLNINDEYSCFKNKSLFKKITKYFYKKDEYTLLENNYTSERIVPTTKHIKITGFSQNTDLFYEYKEQIEDYLYFDSDKIQELKNKYKIVDTDINVMLGFRIDTDGGFKYKSLSMGSYEKVMETFKGNVRFFAVSDIDPSEFLINCKYNIEIINENDIDQFYFGLLCNHFIIGESTFHYWIALLKYIKEPTTSVYIFKDTDLYIRNLIKGLNWNVIEQSVDKFIFLKSYDQSLFDYHYLPKSVSVLKELVLHDPECIAFNTMGYLKNEIPSITPLTGWSPDDGIYIKRKTSNVCFIHSCTINDTVRLDYLMEQLPVDIFDIIFINNIGKPIENKYKGKTIITNYSEDTSLFEIPTINKLIEFSMLNKNINVLYLHTKGILHKNKGVDDWIDLMLYFNVTCHQNALNKLKDVDTVGCNYNDFSFDYHEDGSTTPAPPHFSGNFWWAQSNYLSSLPFIENQCKRNESEYHLFKNNPNYYSLHNSEVNHYHQMYPRENYLFHT